MDLFLTNTQLLALQDVNWWTGVMWISESKSEVTCGQVWRPVLRICALLLTRSRAHTHTHTHCEHTPGAVDYCFYQLFGLSFWWHPFTEEDFWVNCPFKIGQQPTVWPLNVCTGHVVQVLLHYIFTCASYAIFYFFSHALCFCVCVCVFLSFWSYCIKLNVV